MSFVLDLATIVLLAVTLAVIVRHRVRPGGQSPRAIGDGWYVVRDDTVPASYPPRVREELVTLRLAVADGERYYGAIHGLGRVWSASTPLSTASTMIEPDPEIPPGCACSECERPYGLSHLGTCTRSSLHGGSGIVGYRIAYPPPPPVHPSAMETR